LLLHTVWLASQDVIAEVVANGGRDTATATRNSINYAKMANNVFARPSDFDLEGNGARRHLLQDNAAFQRSDRIQVANLAAEVGWERSDCMCKRTWPAHAPK
jgi:hypothetical protein